MREALTWIDERMAAGWRCGDRARHYAGAARWVVYMDESCTGFVVFATDSEHSGMSGGDSSYRACEVAAAIDRWSTECAGLIECAEFIDALTRDVDHAEAKGTRLEIIRAKYLLDAMNTRIAIARAEDTPPFTGYAQRHSAEDAETSTLILPWEAGDDSRA